MATVPYKCPHCGTAFDDEDRELIARFGMVTCPECYREGCENNCMPMGRGVACPECSGEKGEGR